MYLHIGNKKSVKKKDIIGIFDLDTATESKMGKEFINRCEKNGMVEYDDEDLPRSFVVTDNGSENWQVYVSQLSSATLMGRAERNLFEL